MLTGSRASLLGLLAGLVYLWTRSRHKLLVGGLGLIMVTAAFFVMPHQYQERYGTILHKQLDGSSMGRVEAWQTGLVMVMDRPLFGVGAGCFGVAHAMGYSSGAHRNWLESHSLYIQVLAELGVFGAIAFVIMQRQFLKLNRRTAVLLARMGNRRRVEAAIINGLFGGFIVLLVSGVFGHSLYRRTWYVYAGLGLAVYRLLQHERSNIDPEPVSESLPPQPHH